MKPRQHSFKYLILIFFFFVLFLSVLMTSSDFRSLLCRFTIPDRAELSSHEILNAQNVVTKPILDRRSISVDSPVEDHSGLPVVEVHKKGEPEGYSEDNAGFTSLAAVNNKAPALAPGTTTERQGSAKSERSAKKHFYSLHVGSFKESAPAETWSKQLTALGHFAWCEKVHLPTKGDWYRVFIGKKTAKAEAVALGKKLKNDGMISYFAVHKKHDQHAPLE